MLPKDIQNEIDNLPEFLSTIDFANELNWDRRKVDMYESRGIIMKPAIHLK